MKKFSALLISCVLLMNGSVSTVFAEGEEPQTEEPIHEVQIEEVIEEAEEAEETEEKEETPTEDEVTAEEELTEEVFEEAEEPEELVTRDGAPSFTIHFKCGGPYAPSPGSTEKEFDQVVYIGTGNTYKFPDNVFSTIATERGITFWYNPNGGTMAAGDGDYEEYIKKGWSGFKTPCTFSAWRIRSINKWFKAGEQIPEDLAKPGETLVAEAWFHSAVTMPSASRSGYTLVGWNDGWETYTPGETYLLDMSYLMTAQWIGFEQEAGKYYWYETEKDENGEFTDVKQGTYDDPKGVEGDGTIRGREIYDPITNSWYWLDAVYDGARANGKEVWMPYIFQDEKTMSAAKIEEWRNYANTYTENNGEPAEMGDQLVNAINAGTGKWVRYDQNGKMMKGWVTITGELATIYPDQAGNTYFYDYATGLMAKGWTTIGGRQYYFDEITGVLKR